MTKDEMKNRISMALKDPMLQQGFEIICKGNAELEKENAELREQIGKMKCCGSEMTDKEMAEEYENAQDYCGLLDVLFEEQYNQDYGGLSCYISPYIEQAYLAGLKAGSSEWHKVADGDLPEHEVNVLVLHSVQCIDIAHYNYDYKEWHFPDSIVRDVIAWCEIPKYTEE